ncbi:amidohydrolase family protein [Chthonobacter rhizosphaerae]|uniref:amidohydrolase family protein n=1 Tax=Chthonobacter rhizosphaerae TaxID=2735553 RepID=UPI0015EF5D35|nr:amidohydrolase family protein [Chthonobacter rhizosphaerae]
MGKTIIRGGRLIDGAARKADPTDILVIDGVIAEVGPPGFPAPDDAVLFDAAGTILHPGLVNGHTHGMGNLCKGQSDRFTLELLWTGAHEMLDHQTTELKYLNAYLGAVEMVLKGCTTAYDLTFGVPFATTDDLIAIGRAYEDAGMRAVLAPMIADLSFYEAIPGLFDALPPRLQQIAAVTDRKGPEAVLGAMKHALDNWTLDTERVRLGVAPTIPLHCTDELIVGSARLARDYGVVLHSHVAESKTQAVSAFKLWGKTITAHIDDLGLIGPDFTVAHGVWLDDDDMRRLADKGASVSHNAGSNMRLGSGIADARRMLELGVNLAIGTDSANCADNQNMYEAMRYASMVSNVRGPDYTRWLTTPEIIKAATVGGAYATGFSKIGTIAPGFNADIVFLDLKSVNWMPVNEPSNQMVLTEDGTGVKHVMVGGDLVVKDGRHTRCDMDALAAKVEAAHARLAELNAPAKAIAPAFEACVGSFCMGLSRHPYHIERYATFSCT